MGLDGDDVDDDDDDAHDDDDGGDGGIDDDDDVNEVDGHSHDHDHDDDFYAFSESIACVIAHNVVFARRVVQDVIAVGVLL